MGRFSFLLIYFLHFATNISVEINLINSQETSIQ